MGPVGRLASNFRHRLGQVYLVPSNFCKFLLFFAGHCGKLAVFPRSPGLFMGKTAGFYRASSGRALCMLSLRVCVCLSVCPSQVGVIVKRLNIGSRKQRHTVAQGLWFSDSKHFGEIPMGSPLTKCRWGR